MADVILLDAAPQSLDALSQDLAQVLGCGPELARKVMSAAPVVVLPDVPDDKMDDVKAALAPMGRKGARFQVVKGTSSEHPRAVYADVPRVLGGPGVAGGARGSMTCPCCGAEFDVVQRGGGGDVTIEAPGGGEIIGTLIPEDAPPPAAPESAPPATQVVQASPLVPAGGGGEEEVVDAADLVVEDHDFESQPTVMVPHQDPPSQVPLAEEPSPSAQGGDAGGGAAKGGTASLVLSKINGKEKKQKAAALIQQIRKCPAEEAKAMATKPIIKVMEDAPRSHVEQALAAFKKIGVTGRIT